MASMRALKGSQMEEKDYDLMEKQGLGWMNPFSKEFVYYPPEKIEKNKCEKIFKDKDHIQLNILATFCHTYNFFNRAK